MRHTPLSKFLALALSVSLLGSPLLQAEEIRPSAPRKTAAEIIDVALTPQGRLEGKLIDAQGKPLDGAPVRLSRGEEQLGQVATDVQGEFAFNRLESGLYRMETPGQTVSCRVWPAEVAPPSSQESVVMVAGDPAVRGQYGCLDPVNTTALLLGIAGLTVGAITLARVRHVERKVDRVLDELASP